MVLINCCFILGSSQQDFNGVSFEFLNMFSHLSVQSGITLLYVLEWCAICIHGSTKCFWEDALCYKGKWSYVKVTCLELILVLFDVVEIHLLICSGNACGADDVQAWQRILRWTRHYNPWVQMTEAQSSRTLKTSQPYKCSWSGFCRNPELVNLYCIWGSSTSWNWAVGLVGEPFLVFLGASTLLDWHSWLHTPSFIAAFPSPGQKFSLGASKVGSFGLMLGNLRQRWEFSPMAPKARFLFLILGYLR